MTEKSKVKEEKDVLHLSKRERQIMEIVYRQGAVTAVEISEALADPPTHSAVRALIRILESKGHLKHRKDGVRHVYEPTRSAGRTRRSALRRMVDTFFEGSVEQAVAALISDTDRKMSVKEWDRLEALIQTARTQKGKDLK